MEKLSSHEKRELALQALSLEEKIAITQNKDEVRSLMNKWSRTMNMDGVASEYTKLTAGVDPEIAKQELKQLAA
jgi:hypothetical protein